VASWKQWQRFEYFWELTVTFSAKCDSRIWEFLSHKVTAKTLICARWHKRCLTAVRRIRAVDLIWFLDGRPPHAPGAQSSLNPMSFRADINLCHVGLAYIVIHLAEAAEVSPDVPGPFGLHRQSDERRHKELCYEISTFINDRSRLFVAKTRSTCLPTHWGTSKSLQHRRPESWSMSLDSVPLHEFHSTADSKILIICSRQNYCNNNQAYFFGATCISVI